MRRWRGARLFVAAAVTGALALGSLPSAVAADPGPVTAPTPVATAKTAAPKIVSQPKRAYVLHREDATFRVEAKGSGLRYQWYRSYQPLAAGLRPGNGLAKPTWRAIAGATRSSYTTDAPLRLHGSRFRVVVSNSAVRVTSSSAGILVGTRYIHGPHITPTRPSDKPFRPGETAFLEKWAVSFGQTNRTRVSSKIDRLTVKVSAYSGYITTWMFEPTRVKPTSVLALTITSELGLDTYGHRAKLSKLQGDPDLGYSFVATVDIPRGAKTYAWTIARRGENSYQQYFSSTPG